jgi:excisionase family DNA binding protein
MPATVPGERLALRPSEAAHALGVSDRTLRKWMRDEGLPYARVGGAVLIPRAQLEKWMAERVGADNRTDELVSEILDDVQKYD